LIVQVRVGLPEEAKELIAFDEVAHHNPGRIDYITQMLMAGECFVALWEDQLVGYVILTYSFYSNGMIELLYVAKVHRRCGVGRALMSFAESRCRTPKLFTSTNLSNKPMQLFLERSGWKLSGYIDNLDPGDPELVYSKRLREAPN
jgi:GNAT superfamily N-acetyltransferase